MAINTSNKLLPILATLILLIVIGVIYVFTQTDLAQKINFMSMKPTRVKEVSEDGDTAVDTLKTLAVDSAEIRSKYKDVNESLAYQNKKLKEFKDTIDELNKTNAALMSRLEEQDRKMEALKDAGGTGTIDLDKIKEEVVASIKGKLPKLPDGGVLPGKDVDYDVNTLVEGDNEVGKQPGGSEGQQIIEPPDTYSTVHSVNVPVDTDGKVSPKFIKSLEVDKNKKEDSRTDKGKKDEGPIIDPRYTIFANSILNDAVAVTTLIGRIPRKGNVGDAAPFKVIIGRENLMANGFSVPGLDGMIMSGTVFGDANLECVRGKILSATYIFEDGRGITFPKRKRKSKRQLGWISDEHGNPCIPGTYISNVKTQLKNRMMLAMAAGAADAFAKNEVTTLVNSNGGTSTAVTGNSSKFILGSAISNGTKQLTDFLDSQEFDVWDAVVVPSGHRIAVHLDTTLELDQSSLQRRAIYEQNTPHFGLTD